MAGRTTIPPESVSTVSAAHDTGYASYFTECSIDTGAKLAAFPRFVDRSHLARFLVRYELFKRVLDVQGVVVECGVFNGGGAFTFAQISSILEPLNYRRQVIGFDTFAGFPAVDEIDERGQHPEVRRSGFLGSSRPEIEAGISLFDRDRALSHLPKLQFIEGDFSEAGPRFVAENEHLIVSLLYLDFDLAAPTARALELFLPRMPAGAVVAFDEVGVAEFPGETTALMSHLNLRKLHLERLPFTSISWATLTGDE
jgi:hypothetical protein